MSHPGTPFHRARPTRHLGELGTANLPILEQVIDRNTTAVSGLTGNAYDITTGGELILRLQIAGRNIYLHENTPGHRLRFYDQVTRCRG